MRRSNEERKGGLGTSGLAEMGRRRAPMRSGLPNPSGGGDREEDYWLWEEEPVGGSGKKEGYLPIL